MFDKMKYVTSGINRTLDYKVQVMLWRMIDSLQGEKDYLQVFELTRIDGFITKIVNKQEEPEYLKEYLVKESISEEYVKVYVIDDGAYSTMLLSSEY